MLCKKSCNLECQAVFIVFPHSAWSPIFFLNNCHSVCSLVFSGWLMLIFPAKRLLWDSMFVQFCHICLPNVSLSCDSSVRMFSTHCVECFVYRKCEPTFQNWKSGKLWVNFSNCTTVQDSHFWLISNFASNSVKSIKPHKILSLIDTKTSEKLRRV